MILTLVERNPDGSAVETSLEALTFARNLSAVGGGVPVDAVVVGELSDELRKELATYGVRTVHQAAAALQKILQPGDVLLLKGRRPQKLDRIRMILQGRRVRCDRSPRFRGG